MDKFILNNVAVYFREGVPLAISYHPYFIHISKVWSMLCQGSEVRV